MAPKTKVLIMTKKRERKSSYENWPWRFRWLHWGQAKPFLCRTWERLRRGASAVSAKPSCDEKTPYNPRVSMKCPCNNNILVRLGLCVMDYFSRPVSLCQSQWPNINSPFCRVYTKKLYSVGFLFVLN